METYRKMRDRQQKEVNEFPIGFAFSNEQLERELARLETTKEECVSIGAGGFIRKKDRNAFFDMMDRHERERKEAMQDEDFAYSAFLCELNNHEYSYTEDPNDAIEALGLSAKEVIDNPVLNKALCRACEKAMECDW